MKGIPGRYCVDVSPSRAIYHPTKSSWYISILVFSKVLLCFGVYLSYDFQKVFNVIPLVCILKLVSGAVFVLIQKPFTSGKKLTESHWFQVAQYASFRAFLSILWAGGLTLCGPFRTILVYEQYDFVAITLIGSLFSGVGGRSIVRGTTVFALGTISLLLFDHDDKPTQDEDVHTIYNPRSWLGLSDHKLGVCLLACLVACRLGVNAFGRRVAAKLVSITGTSVGNSGGGIGASKRLHALATLFEGIFLLPVSIIIFQFSEVKSNGSWVTALILITIVALFLFVQDYYVDGVCSQRLGLPYTARYGSLSVMFGALIIAYSWNSGPAFTMGETDLQSNLKTSVSTFSPILQSEEHVLSGGGIMACLLFALGAFSLTSNTQSGAKGSLVGYSEAGIPLYNLTASTNGYGSAGFPHSVKSALAFGFTSLKQVLHDSNSRRIFYFLCLNLSFTGIEFLYGIWTNSLGLISDGFHMLFDCSALFMGLVAAIVARWKPSKTFSYGYGRVEDLSGFTNGLFLVVISSFVFWEAVGRLLDPPSVGTQQLLAVSVAGLCVNLLGILAFSSRHSPAATGHDNHPHQHHHQHGHSHNANVEGVFLHILADTLGSIGVITSSVLIEQFGWFIADPICSIFIAVLIFISVIPFLKHSCLVLLLRTPLDADKKIVAVMEKVLSVDGIIGVSHSQFWQHSADTCFGTLHVQAKSEASEQLIIQQVTSLFKEIGLRQVTVQVEKEEFFAHLVALNSKYRGQGFNFCAENALTVVKAL
ncbi:proton-coupled zinc antiporter SLC30A5-like isoform X3 [Hetaerina americana]